VIKERGGERWADGVCVGRKRGNGTDGKRKRRKAGPVGEVSWAAGPLG
jgi:hypothetical protein